MSSALMNGPAMAAPDGQTSNLDNPPNENGLALAILILMIAISTICVLVRAYARVYLLRKIQVEEGMFSLTSPNIRFRLRNGSVQVLTTTSRSIDYPGICSWHPPDYSECA